eukprot:6979019-Prymnesium_polylepis.1
MFCPEAKRRGMLHDIEALLPRRGMNRYAKRPEVRSTRLPAVWATCPKSSRLATRTSPRYSP